MLCNFSQKSNVLSKIKWEKVDKENCKQTVTEDYSPSSIIPFYIVDVVF
jgi:hypothetical protein